MSTLGIPLTISELVSHMHEATCKSHTKLHEFVKFQQVALHAMKLVKAQQLSLRGNMVI